MYRILVNTRNVLCVCSAVTLERIASHCPFSHQITLLRKIELADEIRRRTHNGRYTCLTWIERCAYRRYLCCRLTNSSIQSFKHLRHGNNMQISRYEKLVSEINMFNCHSKWLKWSVKHSNSLEIYHRHISFQLQEIFQFSVTLRKAFCVCVAGVRVRCHTSCRLLTLLNKNESALFAQPSSISVTLVSLFWLISVCIPFAVSTHICRECAAE